MNLGFWEKLKKPIITLAPMADVTDAAFRRLIAKYGKPDVMWTEFVSADGLCHPIGREKLRVDLMYSESERPIVAQLFGANPEKMKIAAAFVQELVFDGLDINMGCPDRTIEKQGAGAATIKNPKLAREIIRAAKEGAPNLPISVKTRIGYNKNELETWLPELLAEGLSAVTIHARTRKEMSKVPARWEHVKEAVKIRDRLRVKTLILGNGDLVDVEDARKKVLESGADGAMLGRAIFGNPWLFANLAQIKSGSQIEHPVPVAGAGLNLTLIQERLKVILEHTKLFEELLGQSKSFALMKKHYKAYVHGWDGANELRNKLMETKNADEVEKIISDYLKTF